jgi:serine/threonine protein kinase
MSERALAQLGRYRIVAELGRGNMGVVYQAEDVQLNRMVAVKTIIAPADAPEHAEYDARFYQEARAAGGLNHPNLVTIHDIGREGSVAYMAMELLDGVELRDLMKRGRLPLSFALDIVAQAAEGLAYAHERGVIHRDIKPGNIMVVRGRHAKIMDFGIARMQVSEVKTQTGAILGSPKYMSPEQVAGRRVDHRSDVFSLGIVLFEAVTGSAPFQAPDVGQLMYQIANVPHRSPSTADPALPPMLDLIVARALEKTADARYQSAAELAADLRVCITAIDAVRGAHRADSTEATVMTPTDAAASAIGSDLEIAITGTSASGGAPNAGYATTVINTDVRAFFPLSQRFDSTVAMQRLGQG